MTSSIALIFLAVAIVEFWKCPLFVFLNLN